MMPDASLPHAALGFWIRVLGLIGAMFVAAVLVRHFDLGWVGVLLLMLLSVAGIIPVIRHTERVGAASGGMSPAMRRYNRRMVASSLLYAVAFFAAVYAYKEWRPEGIAAWVFALLPSTGVVAMVWSMARLLREESDEYLRWRLVQSALFATGLLLVVTTVWGFLEQFALVPHIPSWATVPVFAIGLGLANGAKWMRA